MTRLTDIPRIAAQDLRVETAMKIPFAPILITEIVVVVLGSCAAAFSQITPTKPNLCYAFLRNGQLQTTCEGKQETIHLATKIGQFAVSTDGAYAAFESGSATGLTEELSLVDLQKGSLKYKKTVNRHALMSTSGKLVGVDGDERRDLLTWQRDDLPPYDSSSFVCSADRRVIAGLIGAEELESLYEGNKFAPLHIHRPTGDTQVQCEDFALSPNGDYVVYFTRAGGKPKVCIRGAKGSLSCIPEQLVGRFSLSDSGGVLYAWGVAFEGKQTLKYWHPGAAAAVILSKPGNIQSPQWVTPQVVRALRDWAGKSSSTFKP